MERAVYFDGWLKDQYCFHPSMPMRSTLALEDLERFQATMLVWAGQMCIRDRFGSSLYRIG